MTIDVNNLTGLEDPDELEKLLENATYELDGSVKLNHEPAGDQKQAEEKPAEEKPKEADAKPEEKVEEKATTATDAQAAARDEEGKFVSTKDGKGKIPYDVLVAAREQAKLYREQDLAKQAQLDESARMIETLKKQLTTANLQPADLPENTKIDPEKLKALRDDFPELADIVQTMSDQLEFMKGKVAPAKQQEAPVDNGAAAVRQALNDNATLTDWSKNDADRWETAVTIDQKLMNDSAWKDKTVAERFAEVERRTKLIFGDEVVAAKDNKADPAELQKQAEQKIKEAREQSAVPESPSDVGKANTSNPGNITEWAASASTADIYERMGGMSEAEIEKLLRSAI